MLRSLALLILASLAGADSAGAAQPRTLRDCRNCPEMVAIPGGHFRMGSSADEKGRDALEGPQHQVRVRSFALGKYDVTRGQWRAFVTATHRPTASGCQWVGPSTAHEQTASWRALDFYQNDHHPVVCVTWFDARDYAAWLSRKTGHRYRLPSEAEWEFAARGGSTTRFWWGDKPSHDFANHGTEKCCGGLESGRDRWLFTSPVDAFPANPLGLHDMGGNVLQYLADCFSPDYAGARSDASANHKAMKLRTSGDLADLNGRDSCAYRVVRGGDWADQAAWLRSAARSFAPPPGPGPSLAEYRSGGVGFRVARDLP